MNFADPIGGDPLMNIGRPVTSSKIYGISPAWMEGSLLARHSIYLPHNRNEFQEEILE